MGFTSKSEAGRLWQNLFGVPWHTLFGASMLLNMLWAKGIATTGSETYDCHCQC